MSSKVYKEWIDFKEKIGTWKDKSGRKLDTETNFGIIHYAKKGAHIVPSRPNIEGDCMDISYIRCAIQVALLGHTSSNLRAVVVKIDGNKINLLFFYDSIPSEDEIELANLTETEFMADFPFSVKIDFEIIHLPQPNPIPNSGIFAYFRFEH